MFYSFSRLIAIVANANAHIYAREEQILPKFRTYIKTWKWRFWTTPYMHGGM